MRAVATAGVGVGHAEIVWALSGCDALIGFDSDHRENAQVCRQLGKLIAEREMDARSNGQQNSTSVVIWEGAKGIDDAVRANLPLRVIGIAEWALTLGNLAEAVADIWRQYEYAPVATDDGRRDSPREGE